MPGRRAPTTALKTAPAKAKKHTKRLRCRNCDEPFIPSREWQVFCTPECKKTFHRAGGVSIERMRPIIADMIAAEMRPHVERLADLQRQIDAKLERALRL